MSTRTRCYLHHVVVEHSFGFLDEFLHGCREVENQALTI